MKEYLIKLNRPLLLNFTRTGENNYKTVYGFFARYRENDPERNEFFKENITSYLGYLAMVHMWSNNMCRDKFSVIIEDVEGDYTWVDAEGKTHNQDDWFFSIAAECLKQLDLNYTLDIVDADAIPDERLDKGVVRDTITDESLMRDLLDIAWKQAGRPYTIFLFNRPIWTPKSFLWTGQTGYYNIYGLTISCRYDESLLQMTELYLGQLAMYEDFYLNGQTPSGYKASGDNECLDWIGPDGQIYGTKSKEVEAESLLCKERHYLEVCGLLQLPEKEIPQNLRDDYVVDQALYESWRKRATRVGSQSGCPKSK